jgi:hypothetical protein
MSNDDVDDLGDGRRHPSSPFISSPTHLTDVPRPPSLAALGLGGWMTSRAVIRARAASCLHTDKALLIVTS